MTIWTRWPVSTSMLADPVAHPGRDAVAGRLGLAGQRLGQQADGRQRRAQLVRQVVDELGPDLLEPAQLGDVLEDQPEPPPGRSARADDELGPSAPASADLAGRRAVGEGRARDRLDLEVEEDLDQRPPDQRAGRAASSTVWQPRWR